MSDEVDEQWKEKDNILFYGVYVNTFSLAIAANSYRSTSKFQDFLQKIQKLKQDGILQTQEGTSAIHKIPIEVWSQIELLVIQDALEVSKKELCELAWGNCEDPLREDRVPREGENYTTHACTPSNVYIWVCGECRKAGVEFWKDDVYEKFDVDDFLDRNGFYLVSERPYCDSYQNAHSGDFKSLSPITMKGLVSYGSAEETLPDIYKNSYFLRYFPIIWVERKDTKEITEEIKEIEEIEKLLSIDELYPGFESLDLEEEESFIRRFKSFKNLYNLEVTMWEENTTLVDGEFYYRGDSTGGKFDGSIPKWIKYKLYEGNPIPREVLRRLKF